MAHGHFEVVPLAGALGAEIRGVDLSARLTDTEFDFIYQVFLDYLVIFLPDQVLSPAEQLRFAQRFGEVVSPRFVPPYDMPPIDGYPEIYQLIKEPHDPAVNVGGLWHADVTYRERPNLASIAYVKEAPVFGGDTMYANLYLAYEQLSSGMRTLLDGLEAIHLSTMPYGGASVRSLALSREHVPSDTERNFTMDSVEDTIIEGSHPVVRRHPDTGRKQLYVNRGFTDRFAGMNKEESFPLLQFLFAHCERPEFTCRYRWRDATIGVWDNRCVLHYALNDYFGQRRVMHRISTNEAARPSR